MVLHRATSVDKRIENAPSSNKSPPRLFLIVVKDAGGDISKSVPQHLEGYRRAARRTLRHPLSATLKKIGSVPLPHAVAATRKKNGAIHFEGDRAELVPEVLRPMIFRSGSVARI